jgi:hypothetical protein
MNNDFLENFPNELTNVLTKMPEYAALKAQYDHAVLVERIQDIVTTAISTAIIMFFYRWFRDTRKHLKVLADAHQQSPAIQSDQQKPKTGHAYQKYPKAKQQAPDSQDPSSTNQKLDATVQTARNDSSKHPDSRYMPKS